MSDWSELRTVILALDAPRYKSFRRYWHFPSQLSQTNALHKKCVSVYAVGANCNQNVGKNVRGNVWLIDSDVAFGLFVFLRKVFDYFISRFIIYGKWLAHVQLEVTRSWIYISFLEMHDRHMNERKTKLIKSKSQWASIHCFKSIAVMRTK